jgi:hypothetical protein
MKRKMNRALINLYLPWFSHKCEYLYLSAKIKIYDNLKMIKFFLQGVPWYKLPLLFWFGHLYVMYSCLRRTNVKLYPKRYGTWVDFYLDVQGLIEYLNVKGYHVWPKEINQALEFYFVSSKKRNILLNILGGIYADDACKDLTLRRYVKRIMQYLLYS